MSAQEISTGYEQRAIFDAYHARSQRFALLVYHRRAGKTVAVVNDLIDDLIHCDKVDPRVGYIAPQRDQAKRVAWDYVKRFTAMIPGVRYNEAELRCDLPGGRRMQLFGADNPDAMRGMYFDAVALDEPAQMHPDTWGEIIRPALADRAGRATIMGTPKGRNWFYEQYVKACRNARWFVEVMPVDQSGILSEDEIAGMIEDMNPARVPQELYCSFDAPDAMQFISGEMVEQSLSRYLLPKMYQHSAKLLGVDIARHGDDSTVIVRRQGLWVGRPERHHLPDLMKVVTEVVAAIDSFQPDMTFVDATGMGWGVVDRLRELGYGKNLMAVQTGEKAVAEREYANLRAELWARMRKGIDEGGVVLPQDEFLVRDLTGPEFWYDSKNRMRLEKKESLKSRGMPSPDAADALALTFHANVRAGQGDARPEWFDRLRKKGLLGKTPNRDPETA